MPREVCRIGAISPVPSAAASQARTAPAAVYSQQTAVVESGQATTVESLNHSAVIQRSTPTRAELVDAALAYHSRTSKVDLPPAAAQPELNADLSESLGPAARAWAFHDWDAPWRRLPGRLSDADNRPQRTEAAPMKRAKLDVDLPETLAFDVVDYLK